jgi:hypothetical protein
LRSRVVISIDHKRRGDAQEKNYQSLAEAR